MRVFHTYNSSEVMNNLLFAKPGDQTAYLDPECTIKSTAGDLVQAFREKAYVCEIVNGMIANLKRVIAFSAPNGFAQIKVLNQGDQGPEILTYAIANGVWEYYQQVSDNGLLPTILSIGDIITETWTDYSADPAVSYEVPLKVMHFGDAQTEDGKVYHNKAFISWAKSTPYMIQTDERQRIEVNLQEEPVALDKIYYVGYDGSNYNLLDINPGDSLPTNYSKLYKLGIPSARAVEGGSNRWKTSAFRQWLNSDDPASQWWHSDHFGCVAPTSADIRPGFLSGFSESFRNLLRPYKVRTLLSSDESLYGSNVYEDTYDKMFLPSIEQVMGIPELWSIEGEAWDAMKNLPGMSEPTNDSVNGRNAVVISDSELVKPIRLRTPVLTDGSKVRSISSSGKITDTETARLSSHCTPVFIL